MDSKIGLIIQLSGVCLITLLTLFLRRSLRVEALKHWTHAWLFLSSALFCLRLAFSYEEYSTQLFSFYFLTEYMFGFMLITGCRGLVEGGEMPRKQELLILPLIVIAFSLPFIAGDFNLVYNVHSLIMSAFFGVAFYELWKTKIGTFGWKVMLLAVALLFVDFFQYFVVFTVRQFVQFEFDYLAFNSVIDLVLQLMLGFGMVIVLLELVLTDVRVANEKLKLAHSKLEELAHVDPLTTALNRHAFYGYVKRNGEDESTVSGCIGFFDIDNLKTINDKYGHGVGDIAIRAVVRAIREVIRGEDLLFRWGGDEFFVLMVGLDSEVASQRIAKMNRLLSNVMIEGVYQPLSIGVSHAFEDFADLSDLQKTIETADSKMYRQKQLKKAGERYDLGHVVSMDQPQLVSG